MSQKELSPQEFWDSLTVASDSLMELAQRCARCAEQIVDAGTDRIVPVLFVTTKQNSDKDTEIKDHLFILADVFQDQKSQLQAIETVARTILSYCTYPISVCLTTEVFFAPKAEEGSYQAEPSKHPLRKEALLIQAMNIRGDVRALAIPITRDDQGNMVRGKTGEWFDCNCPLLNHFYITFFEVGRELGEVAVNNVSQTR